MLQLCEQAEAILEKLKAIQGLAQVEYLDSADDMDDRPSRMPAAALVLGQAVPGGPENMTTTVKVTWVVFVKGKNLTGPSGLLAMTDLVLGALSGFQALAGTRPLAPAGVELHDRNGEVAIYAIAFQSIQRAVIHWTSRTT